MENRNRNTAIFVILSVAFLALGKMVGFLTVTGIFLIGLAVLMLRKNDRTLGMILLVAGIIIIASRVIMFLVVLVILLLIYYYLSNKSTVYHEHLLQSYSFVKSWKQTSEPWVLKDTSIRSIIGEINIDLSLAINEKEETTFQLEGIIGDIDLVIPEDMGVFIEASVLLGEITFGQMREEGAMNKMIWQSPNYDQTHSRVRLNISYVIGDVNIRLL